MSSRHGRWARALIIGHRSVAQNDFGLVIIRPVLEGGPEPRATCLATFPYDVVFHCGRPKVRVVNIVHRAVREEVVFHPRSLGCWRKHGIMPKQADWSGVGHHEPGDKERRKEEKLTIGGGLAREYDTLLYSHSSASLQLEI